MFQCWSYILCQQLDPAVACPECAVTSPLTGCRVAQWISTAQEAGDKGTRILWERPPVHAHAPSTAAGTRVQLTKYPFSGTLAIPKRDIGVNINLFGKPLVKKKSLCEICLLLIPVHKHFYIISQKPGGGSWCRWGSLLEGKFPSNSWKRGIVCSDYWGTNPSLGTSYPAFSEICLVFGTVYIISEIIWLPFAKKKCSEISLTKPDHPLA